MDLSAKDDDQEPFFHLSSSTDSASAKARKASVDDKHGFDFSTDDVLPTHDFHQSSTTTGQRKTASLEQGSSNRRHRSSGSPVYLTGELYPARKENDVESYDVVVVSAVERTIKKYADNILRVLEGMSGRLSQLESVSHVLEHSIDKLKVSVDEYHIETDTKMKFLNDHITEMHRSLQILRDRQDIMETHAELARLQASKAEVRVENPKITMSESNPSATSEIVPHEQQIVTTTGQLAIEAAGKIQQMSLSSDNAAVSQQHTVTQPQAQQSQQPQLQPSIQSQTPQTVLQAPVQPQPQTLQQTPVQIQPQHVQQAPIQNQIPQTVQAPVQTHTQAHGQYSQQPHLQSSHQLQMPPNMQHVQPPTQGQNPQQPPLQSSHQVQMPQVMQQAPAQVQGPQIPQLQTAQGQPLQMPPPQLQPAPGQPQQVQQPQGIPQQVHVHQSPAAVTPPSQIQYGSTGLQTVPISQQFSPANPQLQPHQILHNMPPVQQNPQPQESYQFTQQSESPIYVPHPATGPSIQGYGARPFSPSQPLQSLSHQHSNSSYPRNPAGHQPLYLQSSGQNAPLNPRPLPVAQSVYSDPPHSRINNAHYSSYDKITEKVVSMGFSIEEVRSVIRFLCDRGQLVDLNTVLDTLTNGDNHSRRGWQGR